MSNVFVVREVWSDGEADNISHYDDKTEAQEAYKETINNLKEDWGDCEGFEIFSNEDTAILQWNDAEVTVYLEGMPVKEVEIPRFFAEKEITDEVQLTEEEVKELDEIEYRLCKDFGLGKISGGYVTLTIVDTELNDKDEELLQISIESGIDGERSEDAGDFWLNRKTMKIES